MKQQAEMAELTVSSRSARVARVISNVVSPPVVTAAVGIAVSLARTSTTGSGLTWGFVYIALVVGIPMVVLVYLLKTGRVGDLHMRKRGERHLPYAVTFAGALTATVVVALAQGPPTLLSLLVWNVVGVAILGIVNVFWLISNHSASIVLAASFASFVFGPIVGLACLPLVAVILWARLVLKRHTVAQLLAGMVVGVGPVLVLASYGLID